MRHFLRNAVPFCLLLALLLGLLSLVFFPKGNALEDGIQDEALYAFLAEPENSLDAVVLGDSIPLSSFVPAYLWRDQGIPGYVCASTAQSLSESIRLLELFLARQSPRVVLLETDQLYLPQTLGEVLAVKAETYFPVLRYHDNWKFVRPGQMLREASYTQIAPEKGYHLRKMKVACEPGAYMLPGEALEPIAPLARFQVQALLARCRKAGAQMILYTAPNAASWNMPRHNAMEALAEELGISYLDGNLEVTDILWKKDSLDGGEHMNIRGARKVTAWLGEVLAATGLCPDRREDPRYAQWAEALAEFDRRVADPENYY